MNFSPAPVPVYVFPPSQSLPKMSFGFGETSTDETDQKIAILSPEFWDTIATLRSPAMQERSSRPETPDTMLKRDREDDSPSDRPQKKLKPNSFDQPPKIEQQPSSLIAGQDKDVSLSPDGMEITELFELDEFEVQSSALHTATDTDDPDAKPFAILQLKKKYRCQYPIINDDVEKIVNTIQDRLCKDIPELPPKQNEALKTAINLTKPTGTYPGLSVVEINPELGYGVFLNPDFEKIKKGTILGIYSGEYKIIQVYPEPKVSSDYSYAFNIADDFLLDEGEHQKLYGDCDTFIDTEEAEYTLEADAKDRGNWTRFINHAGGKIPNCAPARAQFTYTYNGVARTSFVIVIRAAKRILPGEQLLLDYGEVYWEGRTVTPITPQTYKLTPTGVK